MKNLYFYLLVVLLGVGCGRVDEKNGCCFGNDKRKFEEEWEELEVDIKDIKNIKKIGLKTQSDDIYSGVLEQNNKTYNKNIILKHLSSFNINRHAAASRLGLAPRILGSTYCGDKKYYIVEKISTCEEADNFDLSAIISIYERLQQFQDMGFGGHQDIKPDNIVFDREDKKYKLIDFDLNSRGKYHPRYNYTNNVQFGVDKFKYGYNLATPFVGLNRSFCSIWFFRKVNKAKVRDDLLYICDKFNIDTSILKSWDLSIESNICHFIDCVEFLFASILFHMYNKKSTKVLENNKIVKFINVLLQQNTCKSFKNTRNKFWGEDGGLKYLLDLYTDSNYPKFLKIMFNYSGLDCLKTNKVFQEKIITKKNNVYGYKDLNSKDFIEKIIRELKNSIQT